MKWIKTTAVYLFAAGVFYLLFAYIADFSTRQSIVLALLIASLTRGIEKASAKPVRRFTPYYVRIFPNGYDLLIDFKLIEKPDEWHAIQNSFEELPASEYRLLRSGIYFTVVEQSQDCKHVLIYSNNHRVFVSEIEFDEDVEPIRIDRTDFRGEPNSCDVRLIMRPGRRGDGFDLKLRVPEKWWDQVKASCPKPKQEDVRHLTGEIDLTLATISYREFDLYWEPVEWDSNFYEKTVKKIRARIEDERQKLGWSTIKHDSDYEAELGIDWPESIEHKYFTVEHRRI